MSTVVADHLRTASGLSLLRKRCKSSVERNLLTFVLIRIASILLADLGWPPQGHFLNIPSIKCDGAHTLADRLTIGPIKVVISTLAL